MRWPRFFGGSAAAQREEFDEYRKLAALHATRQQNRIAALAEELERRTESELIIGRSWKEAQDHLAALRNWSGEQIDKLTRDRDDAERRFGEAACDRNELEHLRAKELWWTNRTEWMLRQLRAWSGDLERFRIDRARLAGEVIELADARQEDLRKIVAEVNGCVEFHVAASKVRERLIRSLRAKLREARKPAAKRKRSR